MKKHIAKLLLLAALLGVMMTTLAACGKFQCDLCGRESSGKKHTQKIFGEKITICDNCYKEIKALG